MTPDDDVFMAAAFNFIYFSLPDKGAGFPLLSRPLPFFPAAV